MKGEWKGDRMNGEWKGMEGKENAAAPKPIQPPPLSTPPRCKSRTRPDPVDVDPVDPVDVDPFHAVAPIVSRALESLCVFPTRRSP